MSQDKRARNLFSDKEDQFLIKFIAERNFGPGRTGNRIFQTLADKAQPLADQHTWQSWRNRYMKDREYFDHRIAKYQKSHSIKPTRKAKVNKVVSAKNEIARQERLLESMKRITAHNQAEEEEEEEADNVQDVESTRKREDENGKLKRKKSSDDRIHRSKRQKVSVRATEISSGDGQGNPMGTAEVTDEGDRKNKSRTASVQEISKQPISSDIHLAERSAKEEPEVVKLDMSVIDVPLDGAIPTPTTNEAQSRNIHVNEPPAQPPPVTQHEHKLCEADAADAFFQSIPPTPEHLRSPLAHRRPRGLPHLVDGPFSHSLIGANGRRGAHYAEEEEGSGDDNGQENGRESREGDVNGEWPPLRSRSQVVSHKSKEKGKDIEVSPEIDRQVQTTSIRVNQKIERPARVAQQFLPALRRTAPSVHSRRSPSPRAPVSKIDSRPISTNDPNLNYGEVFRTAEVPLFSGQPQAESSAKSRTKSKDVRRQTIAGTIADSLPEVDLAAAGARSRGRVGLSLPGLRITSSGSSRSLISNTDNRTSSTPPLSINDHDLIYGEGLKAVIRKMSENHGFQEDVTWRLWHHLGHVNAVDKTLRKMREAADAAAMVMVNERESELGGRERDSAAGVERCDRLERWTEHGDYLPTRSHFLSEPSPSLHFTPSPVVDHDSVYTPPEASRAGQFARLVKEGRLREALRREGRKARHGGISPGKIRKVGSLPVPGFSGKKSDHHQSPESRGIAVTNDDSRSARPLRVWGPKEDGLLLAAGRGDELALQDLEATMGKFAVRQRTAHMFTLL